MKNVVVCKPLSPYTDMYNVGHQIKFKGPNEYFRHDPLCVMYVIQETETNARCFLWRQNNPEVNYSPIRISGGGGGGFYRRHYAVGITARTM
jgi:hypothetical protein